MKRRGPEDEADRGKRARVTAWVAGAEGKQQRERRDANTMRGMFKAVKDGFRAAEAGVRTPGIFEDEVPNLVLGGLAPDQRRVYEAYLRNAVADGFVVRFASVLDVEVDTQSEHPYRTFLWDNDGGEEAFDACVEKLKQNGWKHALVKSGICPNVVAHYKVDGEDDIHPVEDNVHAFVYPGVARDDVTWAAVPGKSIAPRIAGYGGEPGAKTFSEAHKQRYGSDPPGVVPTWRTAVFFLRVLVFDPYDGTKEIVRAIDLMYDENMQRLGQ